MRHGLPACVDGRDAVPLLDLERLQRGNPLVAVLPQETEERRRVHFAAARNREDGVVCRVAQGDMVQTAAKLLEGFFAGDIVVVLQQTGVGEEEREQASVLKSPSAQRSDPVESIQRDALT